MNFLDKVKQIVGLKGGFVPSLLKKSRKFRKTSKTFKGGKSRKLRKSRK